MCCMENLHVKILDLNDKSKPNELNLEFSQSVNLFTDGSGKGKTFVFEVITKLPKFNKFELFKDSTLSPSDFTVFNTNSLRSLGEIENCLKTSKVIVLDDFEYLVNFCRDSGQLGKLYKLLLDSPAILVIICKRGLEDFGFSDYSICNLKISDRKVQIVRPLENGLEGFLKSDYEL